MAKIDAVHDALVADDSAQIASATKGYPACTDPKATAACLTAIAEALGSKRGFVKDPPDHAGASTAAVVLLRDGRGDWLGNADTWLGTIKSGKGVGSDVLRLATARKMSEESPAIGKKLDDEAAARAAILAVVRSIPGACPTYWLVATDAADPKTIPPELDPDHSACVQKDLVRREGPGGSYGSGTFRALEGALTLWRETERALRLGLAHAEPDPKAVLEKKLSAIEAATAKIDSKKLPPSEGSEAQIMAYMRNAHAEAGVLLTKPDASSADDAAAAASATPSARPRPLPSAR
jgi:hypothetical protein